MIIIQLLKDTKYPANYQIIIDSSLGNYAVLRDFFSALVSHAAGPCGERVRYPTIFPKSLIRYLMTGDGIVANRG